MRRPDDLARALAIAILVIAAPAVGDEGLQRVFKIPGHDVVLPLRTVRNAKPPTDDVLTQRNNNLRTGATVQAGMNQTLVSRGHFGRVGTLSVDGAVLAQPLYMKSVPFRGGRRDMVFVATSTNWVYAFDANPPFFEQLWAVQLDAPFRIDKGNPNDPELHSCPEMLAQTERDSQHGSQVMFLGVESTPAIEPSPGRLVISYRTVRGGPSGVQRITALDIHTGQRVKGPRGTDLDHAVTDGVPELSGAEGTIWHGLSRNRASLLIDHGVVYVAFSARCEGDKDFNLGSKAYHGWILAFDVQTLEVIGTYRATQEPPKRRPSPPSQDHVAGGGIWQGSTGLAADGNGSVFFVTGNGSRELGQRAPDREGKNLSDSVVRLQVTRPRPASPMLALTPTDWFTPYNKVWLDQLDLDFGSAGVVLIPETPLLLVGGKAGMLYVLDRNNLGKFDDSLRFDPGSLAGHTTGDVKDDPRRDRVVQKEQVGVNRYCLAKPKAKFCSKKPGPKDTVSVEEANKPAQGVTMDDWWAWPHIHGTPVFGAFEGGQAFVYVWPEKDRLKSFKWSGAGLDAGPSHREAVGLSIDHPLAPPYSQLGAIGMPGGMLSLSIDPSRDGSGVLFASVQRCRSDDSDAFHECATTDCDSDPSPCNEQHFGMLRAFDPIDLRELWNDQVGNADADRDYWFAKFVPPTIANGHVYLATASGKILVYGRTR